MLHPNTSCNVAPPVVVDTSKLSAIVTELESRISKAEAIAYRLHQAMDYVSGPVPTAATDDGTKPAYAGVINAAQDKLDTLFRLLDSIDDGVRRLERVVG